MRPRIGLGNLGLRGLLIAGAFLGGSLIAGCALHHQNHMNDALSALNVAAAALGQATPDAAGHVSAALRDTQAAISEVEAGMSYKIQTGQQPNPAS
jgi:outer membrane murein-binding lipoprotein Lpp